MALPVLDATFASSADLPRRQMLAKWLVNLSYAGSVEDYYTLPEKYIYAKIAVASGAARSEYDYTSLPDRYTLSDIYKAVSGSSADTIDRGEKEALGWIAAAVRGDAGDPAKVATYINWPWRYQVASIITALAVDSNAQSFITASGATDVEGIDRFVKGIKALGLYDSMVCWPLRSSQNAGTGTTAYSLGGLGVGNGTLINGPTWGADGITFVNASTQRIHTTFSSSLTSDMLLGGVAKFTDTGIRYVAGLGTGPGTRGFELTQGSSSVLSTQLFGSTVFAPSVNHSATQGSLETYATLTTNSGTTVRVIFGTSSNAGTSATHVPTAGSQALAIGAQGVGFTSDRNMQGDIVVVFFVRGTAATLANYLALRLLIKSTLGQGLAIA